MEQLELKYKTQINKNSSLLRMNSALMTKNDILNHCIYSLHLIYYPEEKQVSSEHQFEQEELQQLISYAKNHKETESTHCFNCQELEEQLQKLTSTPNGHTDERWKQLYIKQSEQTFRLSKINSSLMDTLRQFEVKRKTDEEQLKLFLEDYFQIFKKMWINPLPKTNENQLQDSVSQEESTTKKKQRSKSANKGKKMQKFQKQKTILLQQSGVNKVQKHWKMLNKLRQMAVGETETIRKELVQTLKVLRISEQNTRLVRRSLIQQIL